MKGIKTMKNQIKLSKTYKDEFRNDAELVQKAKALFMALYSQQDLEKAIGSLSFQDCLNLCKRLQRVEVCTAK